MSQTYFRDAQASLKSSLWLEANQRRAKAWDEKGIRASNAVGTPWRGSKAEWRDLMLQNVAKGMIQGIEKGESHMHGVDDFPGLWETLEQNYFTRYVVLNLVDEQTLEQAVLDILSQRNDSGHQEKSPKSEVKPNDGPDIVETDGTEIDATNNPPNFEGQTLSTLNSSDFDHDVESQNAQEVAEIVKQVSRASTGLTQDDDYYLARMHADHETTFTYDTSALLQTETSIRILELQPGTKDDTLTCNLTQHSPDDCPPYEALSYTWGEPGRENTISVDGGNFQIRHSLAHALFRLRLPRNTRRLWIDAICINQSDDQERSEQVAIMKKIYQQAKRVLIWLGPPDEVSSEAFELLNAIASSARKDSSSGDSDLDLDYHDMSGTYTTTEMVTIDVGGVGKQYNSDSVRLLLLREWFSRVWVIQEVAMAREAVIIWGTETLDWESFRIGLSYGMKSDIFHVKTLGLSTEIAFRRFEALASVMKSESNLTPVARLLQLLGKFMSWKASDARDKVFALLGLVEDDLSQYEIAPDYQLSTGGIFVNTAKNILENTSDLRLLSYCSPSDAPGQESTLPSWVPDWSDRAETTIPFDDGVVGRFCTSKACASTVANCTFLNQSTFLGLDGYIVDSIAEISSTLPPLFATDPSEIDTDTPQSTYPERPHDYDEWSWSRRFMFGMRMLRFSLGEAHNLLHPYASYLACLIEWESFAKIGDDTRNTPTGESNKTVYMLTLIAGCIPTDLFTIEAEFDEWLSSLTPIRQMVQLGVAKYDRLFTPMAVAGYMKETWQKYQAFTVLLEHASLRRLAWTKAGYLALVPGNADVGDAIGVFKGSRWPIVIRAHDDTTWKLIGLSHVHGIISKKNYVRRSGSGS